MKIATIGLCIIITASMLIGGYSQEMGWTIEIPVCIGLGILSVYYLHRIKLEYGNDLFLKTLTKAKQEGITITVTNAVCPHCGENIFEPMP
jgi:hypothetical protein